MLIACALGDRCLLLVALYLLRLKRFDLYAPGNVIVRSYLESSEISGDR
ncbi:MAG: hypothetical protein PUP90_18480 [Nostoc sp. S4]|nr:hypothetical protein [Nostoc sp. S4]